MWRCFFFFFVFSLHAEITALYLSWYDNPTTTMTIQWHTPPNEPVTTLFLHNGTEWQPVTGTHTPLDTVLVHTIRLNQLTPDTEYYFHLINDETVYKFRTAPANLNSPIRFVIGGDLFDNVKLTRRMNQTVLENDPLFAVIGGDIAYAIHSWHIFSSPLSRWLLFLKEWKEQMVTSDGRLIPFLLVPGNHDIQPDNYELFFKLFAFPTHQLYRTLDFDSYLTLFLLDTGHFHPIKGKQTLWLEKTLATHANIPYRFAIYHKAAYPSHYSYHEPTARKIRSHWCPLFDQYQLTAAFENDNHSYKRTYPLKGNRIHPEGVTYFGDGCWGTKPRSINDLWYLVSRARKNNVILITLSSQDALLQAIDLNNQPIDQLILSPINK